MNDGSFFFPLLGTGAKKGLSVSIKTLSIEIDLKVVGLKGPNTSEKEPERTIKIKEKI